MIKLLKNNILTNPFNFMRINYFNSKLFVPKTIGKPCQTKRVHFDLITRHK